MSGVNTPYIWITIVAFWLSGAGMGYQLAHMNTCMVYSKVGLIATTTISFIEITEHAIVAIFNEYTLKSSIEST